MMSLQHQNSNSAAAQSLSFDDIADFFSLPLYDAASTLGNFFFLSIFFGEFFWAFLLLSFYLHPSGVCASVLKKICRENGLDRWPHRKVTPFFYR